MSSDDGRLLVDELNARQPGSAEFVNWPKLDHVLYRHARAQLAFHQDSQQAYDAKVTDYVLAWLKAH